MNRARTLQQTEAIVLRVIDYGESDRIVTFCTADFGKIRGIAKGARRSRKRFVNTLEPFSCSRVHFSRRGPDTLALIEGCDVLSHFPGIRADLEKTLAASLRKTRRVRPPFTFCTIFSNCWRKQP
jgi:DNA repair protein RecO (recombination protein O)